MSVNRNLRDRVNILMGISENKTCTCKADKVKGDEVFSPLKGKMKVLKKIKRRMGLGA